MQQARRPGSDDSGEARSAHDSVERWLSASYEAAEREPVSPSADRDRDSLNLSGAESANAADDDDRYEKTISCICCSLRVLSGT